MSIDKTLRKRRTYLSLNHVDTLQTQLPDAVVHIYDSLVLGHLQHDVNDDETTGATSPSTACTLQQMEVNGSFYIIFRKVI